MKQTISCVLQPNKIKSKYFMGHIKAESHKCVYTMSVLYAKPQRNTELENSINESRAAVNTL